MFDQSGYPHYMGQAAGYAPFNSQDRWLSEELIHNVTMGRTELINKLLDPRRDLYKEVGVPDVVSQAEYKKMYDRNPIAARVVEVFPKESWQVLPSVYAAKPAEEEGEELLAEDEVLSDDAPFGGSDGSDEEDPDADMAEVSEEEDELLPDEDVDAEEDEGTEEEEPVPPAVKKDKGKNVLTNAFPFGNDEADQAEGVDAVEEGTEDPAVAGQFPPPQPAAPTPKLSKQPPEPQTPFDKAWDALGTALSGEKSYNKTKDVHPIWEHLLRLDILSGIGRYGVLLIGVDDENGYDLSMPIDGVEEEGSIPSEISDEVKARYKSGQQGTDAQYNDYYTQSGKSKPVGNRKGQHYSLTFNTSKMKGHKLAYLRCFSETNAQITRWESNPFSTRYGKPLMYLLTFNDPESNTQGVGRPISSMVVHWTRVVHVADNCLGDDILGMERMHQVYNNIHGLDKLLLSSPEMFYKGAFPGLALSTHPQLGGDVKVDKPGLRGMVNDYHNGLQRALMLMGMSAQTLAPQVSDPTAFIKVQLEAICIKLGIPMRVFLGSERGELASSQDDAAWNDRLKARQNLYLSMKLITPVIDRLINIGILPKPPDGYVIEWPDLGSDTKAGKATVANTITTALSTYSSGNASTIIPPREYLIEVLGFTEDQVDSFMDAAEAQAEEQAALGAVDPMTGEPMDSGFGEPDPNAPFGEEPPETEGELEEDELLPLDGEDELVDEAEPPVDDEEEDDDEEDLELTENQLMEVLSAIDAEEPDIVANWNPLRDKNGRFTTKQGTIVTPVKLKDGIGYDVTHGNTGAYLGQVVEHLKEKPVYGDYPEGTPQRKFNVGKVIGTRKVRTWTAKAVSDYGFNDFSTRAYALDHIHRHTGIVANYSPNQTRDSRGRFGYGSASQVTSKGEKLYEVTRDPETKTWGDAKGRLAPEHIQKLAIPPAWKSVHVNPDPAGTVLAKGIDSKGRTQIRYSANHNAKKAAEKFGRVSELRRKRSQILSEVNADTKVPELKEKAEVLKLVMMTGIRPGGDKDTHADHESYGATTLLGKHVVVDGDSTRLVFPPGKNKGRPVTFNIENRGLADMLRKRAEIVGKSDRLFDVDADELRAYSMSKDGKGFKTKDHRTALGTETAIDVLSGSDVPTSVKEYKALVKDVATRVSRVLGNTPAIALKSYIDPTVWAKFKPAGI